MGLKAVANLGSGGGGGGISGSGSSPYVAVWSGTSAITTGSLVDTGSRVGILQTSPVTTFQVGGNTVATPSPVGAFCTLGSNSRFTADDGTRAVTLAADGTSAIVGTTTAHDLVLQRGGVTAATIKAGAIATLTGATPAATNGTYSQLALTGGTGTGATADIVVSGGAVSSVVLRAPGNGYTVGDLLTCPTLTGLGVGVTVATVATVISDIEGTANITASGRLGAFTPNPRAGLDVAAGGALFGAPALMAENNFVFSSQTGAGTVSVSGTAVTGTSSKFLTQFQVGSSITCTTTSGSETRIVQSITDDLNLIVTVAFTGTASSVTYTATYPKYTTAAYARLTVDPTLYVVPTNLPTHVLSGTAYFDATNVTTQAFRYIYGGIIVKNLAAGWTGAQQFIGGGMCRQEPTDLATTGSWFGASISMRVEQTCGSNTTASMTCYSGSVNNSKSGHTITTGTVYTSLGSTVAGATITTFSNYNAQLTNNGTITTSYGLRLQTPTGTGTITTRYGISQEDTAAINQFAGTVQFNNGFGSVATVYGTRAWVNFNGTGVVAIRGSGNVSTITDLGVGSYSVNFTTAMPDVNYSAHATVGYDGAVGSGIVASVDRNSAAAAVGSVRVYLFNTTFAVADSTMVFVSVTR